MDAPTSQANQLNTTPQFTLVPSNYLRQQDVVYGKWILLSIKRVD